MQTTSEFSTVMYEHVFIDKSGLVMHDLNPDNFTTYDRLTPLCVYLDIGRIVSHSEFTSHSVAIKFSENCDNRHTELAVCQFGFESLLLPVPEHLKVASILQEPVASDINRSLWLSDTVVCPERHRVLKYLQCEDKAHRFKLGI